MAKAKARKWQNQAGQFPAPPEDKLSERFKKVLELKDKVKGEEMDVIAELWNKLDAEEDAATVAAAERSLKYEALELVVQERLEQVKAASGQDTWRGNGRLFSPKFTICPVIRDKVALRKWIEDTKQQDLLSLAAPTLKALTVALLEQVEAMTPEERSQLTNEPGTPGNPPPGVEVFIKPGVNATSK